jgi:hypothetical protein
MLLAPHIIVGAAVAAQFSNPALGLGFAFLSHFLLDRIPHWEYSVEGLKNIKTSGIKKCLPLLKKVFLDVSAGFLVAGLASFLSQDDIPLWAWLFGGLFGALPDSFSFLLFLKRGSNGLLYNFLKVFYMLHQRVHYSKKNGLPPLRIGLSTQAIAVLLALYFLLF